MPNFKTPLPGQVITVTTRYKNGVATRDGEWVDTTYKNVPVITPQTWTKPDEFCIPAEGEPYITFRTINVSNVIELTVEGKAGEVATSTATEYKTVPGGKGNTYTVTLVNGVATVCECLGFQYRKECRHLRIAMGETPVNPRRETVKKQKRKVAAKKRQAAPRNGTQTKAQMVRNIIREHKDKHCQSWVSEQVVQKIGMSRALATTYVRNNWEKV